MKPLRIAQLVTSMLMFFALSLLPAATASAGTEADIQPLATCSGHDHDSTIGDNRGCGYTNSARTRIGACDNRADGWGVRTYYRTSLGVPDSVGDHNGSAGGCGEEGPSGGGYITEFYTCAGPNGADSKCGPKITF